MKPVRKVAPDTGARKSTLAMAVVAGLVAAQQWPLAAAVAIVYLVLNTVLHVLDKADVD